MTKITKTALRARRARPRNGHRQHRIRRWARAAAQEGQDAEAIVARTAAALADAAAIAARLVQVGVVDDTVFAQARARRLRGSGRSARATLAHLSARGWRRNRPCGAGPREDMPDELAARSDPLPQAPFRRLRSGNAGCAAPAEMAGEPGACRLWRRDGPPRPRASHSDFLERLLGAENDARIERQRAALMKTATLPSIKTIGDYDFAFASGAPGQRSRFQNWPP